ncbi:MAG: thioredoxin domain-containing protein [Pirellulaceae bacterium]
MTADWKVEPDDATFEQQVVEQSFKTPVLVDFWAAWCAPCRMLGPILEKVVEARAGKVILAKVDTSAAPKAAGSFRVQSIPAVYLLDRGEVVDGFQGMIPESQLANWLDERPIDFRCCEWRTWRSPIQRRGRPTKRGSNNTRWIQPPCSA